jgi:hypothetical protein
MDDCTVFVGLDYHKDSIQVCVLADDGRVLGNRGCVNDPRQVAATDTDTAAWAARGLRIEIEIILRDSAAPSEPRARARGQRPLCA